MNAEMQPLFWRISHTDQQGIDAVSLLMPASEPGQATEFPTDVSFPASSAGSAVRDLRWSDEDSELFLDLVDRVIDTDDSPDIELDLNDDVIQGIVQLVALRRFRTPRPLDEWLGDDVLTEREELEIGDLVSLNTLAGSPVAIIVGLDSIDATCILLEDLYQAEQLIAPMHSVLMVNRLAVLPSAFAVSDDGEGAVFH
ncbi:hypothetical protein [Bacterioplanoides pacificum]|uniref:Uncharacterized protein n=1 Tax=Bacterioplanoides pacificum TaxID=1171596 RepID=A0ABV7VUE8_9GAMM